MPAYLPHAFVTDAMVSAARPGTVFNDMLATSTLIATALAQRADTGPSVLTTRGSSTHLRRVPFTVMDPLGQRDALDDADAGARSCCALLLSITGLIQRAMPTPPPSPNACLYAPGALGFVCWLWTGSTEYGGLWELPFVVRTLALVRCILPVIPGLAVVATRRMDS